MVEVAAEVVQAGAAPEAAGEVVALEEAVQPIKDSNWVILSDESYQSMLPRQRDV